MKKLLLVSIFFTFAIVVPMPTMAGANINAGISLAPPIVFEAPPEVIAMPASGVFVFADADTDTPQGGTTGSDEKQQVQTLEKEKPTESQNKSDWKINVWPAKPTDNIKSLPQMKEENIHIPPDRAN